MSRPLRLEFSGALYHVTSRGDRRGDIYRDDGDREAWLSVLERVCRRFNWVVHAYCQMTNHYHLLVETVDANLSQGMQQLNGQYTQRFNRRHQVEGHLFQGRYKAVLVQKEEYLLELIRYVVLNPIRAGKVAHLEDWHWSSYRAMVGLNSCPQWLDADGVLKQFATARSTAVKRYQLFILEGKGLPSPLKKVRYQLLLGNDSFVDQYHEDSKPEALTEVSKTHRKSLTPTLSVFQATFEQRNEAMARAYLSGAYTMKEIGEHFGVHYMTVSRAVRQFENDTE